MTGTVRSIHSSGFLAAKEEVATGLRKFGLLPEPGRSSLTAFNVTRINSCTYHQYEMGNCRRMAPRRPASTRGIIPSLNSLLVVRGRVRLMGEAVPLCPAKHRVRYGSLKRLWLFANPALLSQLRCRERHLPPLAINRHRTGVLQHVLRAVISGVTNEARIEWQ